MVEQWTAFLRDISESCWLVDVYPSFQAKRISGGMFTFRAPCMSLSVSHCALSVGNMNCWMHTLYRDANGEREEADWLMCFVDHWLTIRISEWLIRHLVCKWLVFSTTFVSWLVFGKLGYLILWIVCKMSTQFSWCSYGLLVCYLCVLMHNCLFACCIGWLANGCLDHWLIFFYIHGSVHRNSILIRSNKMQQYAGIYLLQTHSACFGCPSHPSSGVHKTVTAASVQVIVSEQQPSSNVAYRPIGLVGGRLLLRYYDLYQRLQLQFYVLLMIGAMDTRNM
jgi:hypothetical protein